MRGEDGEDLVVKLRPGGGEPGDRVGDDPGEHAAVDGTQDPGEVGGWGTDHGRDGVDIRGGAAELGGPAHRTSALGEAPEAEGLVGCDAEVAGGVDGVDKRPRGGDGVAVVLDAGDGVAGIVDEDDVDTLGEEPGEHGQFVGGDRVDGAVGEDAQADGAGVG